MLTIAGTTFASRLFVGTGKFSSSRIMQQAVEASGSQMVTVALRRVDLNNPQDDIMQALDRDKVHFLPNTSGARNAEEAVRLARLARAASGTSWLKLEVTPDPRTCCPIRWIPCGPPKYWWEGFKVLPYINADPILALKLQDAGAAAVMPLGSPIGTNQGLQTAMQVRIIIEQARVPVVSTPASALTLACCRGHGDRGGRRTGQYRHCRGRRSGSHGPGLCSGRRGRA
jgi:thiazole synthase